MADWPTTPNYRDVWDDATSTYTGYDAAGNVVEQRPYTADEQAAATASANAATLRTQAGNALQNNLDDIATNDTFLAIAAPTNAQVVAQVKELTRQSTRHARELDGLIRLVIRRLDATA